MPSINRRGRSRVHSAPFLRCGAACFAATGKCKPARYPSKHLHWDGIRKNGGNRHVLDGDCPVALCSDQHSCFKVVLRKRFNPVNDNNFRPGLGGSDLMRRLQPVRFPPSLALNYDALRPLARFVFLGESQAKAPLLARPVALGLGALLAPIGCCRFGRGVGLFPCDTEGAS